MDSSERLKGFEGKAHYFDRVSLYLQNPNAHKYNLQFEELNSKIQDCT